MSLQRMASRALDILVVATLALPAAVVVALVAPLIVLESPGSPFFLQKRVGLNNRDFRVVKLRTMVPNAEAQGAGLYLEQNDYRLTRLGRVLRRLSIDEIPQLWNVLAGTMALVGPRPMPRSVVDQYPEQYAVILTVKPGITGAAQVAGRNELPRSERLTIDMHYATHRSFAWDVRILISTLSQVATGRGQRNYGLPGDVEGVPRSEGHEDEDTSGLEGAHDD